MDISLAFLTNSSKSRRQKAWIYATVLTAQGVVWQLQGKLPKLGAHPVKLNPLHALADELLLPRDFLWEIDTLLDDKRQVIFQGPPGTGKTYVAQALARCLAGAEHRVTLVQFHPSYAYEDFVRGFRPTITESGQGRFRFAGWTAFASG